jgi:predicted RNase H-like HicB family nuclease
MSRDPGRALQSASRGLILTDYHINIFYSDEDGGYIADIPDLEACSAFGLTPAKALAALEQAKEAWLAVARETGKAIPVPRYRPVIYQCTG